MSPTRVFGDELLMRGVVPLLVDIPVVGSVEGDRVRQEEDPPFRRNPFSKSQSQKAEPGDQAVVPGDSLAEQRNPPGGGESDGGQGHHQDELAAFSQDIADQRQTLKRRTVGAGTQQLSNWVKIGRRCDPEMKK